MARVGLISNLGKISTLLNDIHSSISGGTRSAARAAMQVGRPISSPHPIPLATLLVVVLRASRSSNLLITVLTTVPELSRSLGSRCMREWVVAAVFFTLAFAVVVLFVQAATIGSAMSAEEAKGEGETKSGPLYPVPKGTSLPIVGKESIMAKKAHGTCEKGIQASVRWGCDREVRLATQCGC